MTALIREFASIAMVKFIIVGSILGAAFFCAIFLVSFFYLRNRRLKAISLALTILLGVYALGLSAVFVEMMYIEPNWIKLERVQLRIPHLAEALSGVKIVHISDLHITEYGIKERRLVKLINSAKPDIILFTGELVGELHVGKDGLQAAAEVFKHLSAPLGIWAAPDIFDSYLLKDARLREELNKIKIKFLINDNVKLFTKKDAYFRLIGVTDASQKHANLNRAMAGIRLNEPKILLSHSPEIIDEAKEYKIDLVLSGHTQGGQCGIAWIRNRFDYIRKYQRYIAGLYKFDDTFLYVNRGIETRAGTGRLLCRPEVTAITIRN